MKKRRLLLLLLLPPGALCAALTAVTLWEGVLIYLGVTALGFGLETLVLYLTRNRLKWLRLVTLALLAIPLGLAWEELAWGGFFSDLAAVMWILAALCGLCGWGAAWALAPDKGEKEGEHREA